MRVKVKCPVCGSTDVKEKHKWVRFLSQLLSPFLFNKIMTILHPGVFQHPQIYECLHCGRIFYNLKEI